MRLRSVFLMTCLAFFYTATVVAETSAADFHENVVKLYSFSPRKLTQEEIEKKSSELEVFWKKVTSDREILLPMLRGELKRADNPPFFFFDGSQLLLKLSNDKADKELAISAIARSDIRDLSPPGYLMIVNKLGTDGLDNSMAAFRVLDYPDFKAFIAEHALTLGQNYALEFMLSPLTEDIIVDGARKQLALKKDVTSRKSLLLLLWYTTTKTGDEIIAKMAADKNEDGAVREYAQQMIKRTEAIESLSASRIDVLKTQYALELSMKMSITSLGNPSMPKGMKNLSKKQLQAMKIFLRSLKASGDERAMKMLADIKNNSDGTVPPELSEYAQALLENKQPATEEGLVSLPEDIGELRKMRREQLNRLSDEALKSHDVITAIIRWKLAQK